MAVNKCLDGKKKHGRIDYNTLTPHVFKQPSDWKKPYTATFTFTYRPEQKVGANLGVANLSNYLPLKNLCRRGADLKMTRYPGVSRTRPPANVCQPFGLIFGGGIKMRPSVMVAYAARPNPRVPAVEDAIFLGLGMRVRCGVLGRSKVRHG